MRILWGSNAPWANTGYGVQTADVVRRLVADGHEVAVAANYGLAGAMMEWEGVPVFPSGTDAYSNDIWPAQFVQWARGKPAWFITLFDTWVLHPEYFKDLNVASWTPVDHFPAPSKVVEWSRNHKAIAMSRFGQSALAREGVTSTYIPHGVDTSVFKPRDKAEARAKLGIAPGAFVVGMNAANKGNSPARKAWSENFGALAVFFEKHPDAVAYINSDVMGIGGVDLRHVGAFWGIDPKRLAFSPQFEYKIGQLDQEFLTRLYAASDVLLAASYGEGFGVPTIEAQACGTPVIVSDWAASPELVGGGWKVGVQPIFDPSQVGAAFGIPLIPSIADALEQAYAAKGDPAIRQAAIDKAQEYDATRVYAEYWRPFLAILEAELTPSRQQKRSAKRKRAA